MRSKVPFSLLCSKCKEPLKATLAADFSCSLDYTYDSTAISIRPKELHLEDDLLFLIKNLYCSKCKSVITKNSDVVIYMGATEGHVLINKLRVISYKPSDTMEVQYSIVLEEQVDEEIAFFTDNNYIVIATNILSIKEIKDA